MIHCFKFSRRWFFFFYLFVFNCFSFSFSFSKSEKSEERTDIYFSHEYDESGRAICSDLTLKLISLLSTAKKRIFIAIYMLTDERISSAIISAKERVPNIEVAVIVDELSVEYVGGKALSLADKGVSVYVFNFDKLRACKKSNQYNKEKKVYKVVGAGMPSSKQAIMHNKYAVVDDILWTGSFNFTCRANNFNQENVVVTTNKAVVSKAVVNFKNHLRHSDLLCPTEVCGRVFRSSDKRTKTETLFFPKKIGERQTVFALAKRICGGVVSWCSDKLFVFG
jgi:phosphatidylserine/phosphatidylglycerophosphate/cardiolipin synthase-like enzyme